MFTMQTQDQNGETVFHWATRCGYTTLMEQLVEHVKQQAKPGTKQGTMDMSHVSQLINVPNQVGHSPLVLAVLAEQMESFRCACNVRHNPSVTPSGMRASTNTHTTEQKHAQLYTFLSFMISVIIKSSSV